MYNLKISDVMGLLNISRSTLRRWEALGLPYVQIPGSSKRFSESEINAWMLAHRRTEEPKGEIMTMDEVLKIVEGASR